MKQNLSRGFSWLDKYTPLMSSDNQYITTIHVPKGKWESNDGRNALPDTYITQDNAVEYRFLLQVDRTKRCHKMT